MNRSRIGFLAALGLVFCASATAATAEEMRGGAADHATEAFIEARMEHIEGLLRDGGLKLPARLHNMPTEQLRQALEP